MRFSHTPTFLKDTDNTFRMWFEMFIGDRFHHYNEDEIAFFKIRCDEEYFQHLQRMEYDFEFEGERFSMLTGLRDKLRIFIYTTQSVMNFSDITIDAVASVEAFRHPPQLGGFIEIRVHPKSGVGYRTF